MKMTYVFAFALFYSLCLPALEPEKETPHAPAQQRVQDGENADPVIPARARNAEEEKELWRLFYEMPENIRGRI